MGLVDFTTIYLSEKLNRSLIKEFNQRKTTDYLENKSIVIRSILFRTLQPRLLDRNIV